jgi:hypothetical protein
MKTMLKIAVVVTTLVLMLIADVPLLPVQLVPEAQAIFGTRRRSFRRGVVVGASAGEAEAAQQQQQKQQQQQQQQQQQPAAAPPSAPPPAATGKPLPVGTVVQALPPGCTSTPVGGVEYYYCGGNFYRAVFQGNQLVYVTAKP